MEVEQAETVGTTDPGAGASQKFVEVDNNGQVTETPIPHRQAKGESDPHLYTKDDLEKARQQEKDKLYTRLGTMQEQLSELEKERSARKKAEQESQQAEEERLKLERQQEMSAKELLEQKEAEWQAQLSQVQQQMEAERALREQEARFSQLMEYRQQILAQYQEKVAPELMDLIQGDTPEAIAQSAEDMAARTQRILAQTQEAMQTVRQRTPTTRVSLPASGENSGSQVSSMTPDEIRSMSMSDYAKRRQQLLGGGADGPKNRGLFG